MSTVHEERLAEIETRIDRIALHPEQIDRPVTRLVAPIFAAFGWRPKIRVRAMRALLQGMHAPDEGDERVGRLLEALAELEGSIDSVERHCAARGRAPIAYASCLRRVYEVVARCARATDDVHRRLALDVDPTMTLLPLETSKSQKVPPQQVRLLELQLGSIDHLLDAARAEPDVLSRRRRLLEAARQVLLETAAALSLEPEGVESRRCAIAEEITRIDRLQAAGVDVDVGLVHQARLALATGDRRKLHAIVVALDGAAVRRGDAASAACTGRVLDALWGGADRTSAAAQAESLLCSAREVLGARVVDAVDRGYAAARRSPFSDDNAMLVQIVRNYLAPGQERSTLAAALAVDGSFEVGGALCPVRIVEHELRVRVVRRPTPDLALVPAREPLDVVDAVIDDPRALLLDLAAGRLLTRRFVQEEQIERSRVVMQSEVRIYVLDGSGSMIGPRARMRDAIMIAELATLLRRIERHGAGAKTTIFYRYFAHDSGDVVRVDTEDAALAAIAEVAGTIRRGGTDIQLALLASLELVRRATASDPELARAQIVLVTDGEAHVDEKAVEQARVGLEQLPIGLSVVALGCENAALRSIVARQRARGERAFYHFIGDDALDAIDEGRIDRGDALHTSGAPPLDDRRAEEALRALTERALDELAALGRARDTTAIESLEIERRARVAAERDSGTPMPMSEGELARAEALTRDARALERRFERWFPTPKDESFPPEEGTREGDELEAAIVALTTVAEVIHLTSGTPLARRADAIELLERLLPDGGLTPWRYEEIVRAQTPAVSSALAAVHDAI